MKKNPFHSEENNSEREIMKREIISKLLDTDILFGAEQKVLKEYLVYEKPLKEIASLFRLSPIRAKQVLNNSLTILKLKLSSNEKIFYTLRKQQEEIEKFRYEATLKEQNEHIFKSLPEEMQKILSEKLEKLPFDARVVNACANNNITTLRDLTKLSKRKFCAIRDIGKKSIRETEAFLQSKGLDWEMDV